MANIKDKKFIYLVDHPILIGLGNEYQRTNLFRKIYVRVDFLFVDEERPVLFGINCHSQ